MFELRLVMPMLLWMDPTGHVGVKLLPLAHSPCPPRIGSSKGDDLTETAQVISVESMSILLKLEHRFCTPCVEKTEMW